MITFGQVLNVKGEIPRLKMPNEQILILGVLEGTDYNVVYMDPFHKSAVSLIYPELVVVDGKPFTEWFESFKIGKAEA